MMRILTAFCSVLALAACSSEPAQQGEGADDFASRIGSSGSSAEGQTAPLPTNAVKAAPAPGANVFALEKLGNISDVDLGPRAGGCTFSVDGNEMLIAAGPADAALPGKATVRVGGQLLLLDAPPGGYEAVKSGTAFNGEGFSVSVQPTGPETGQMTITNNAGQQQAYAGRWVCS